MNEYEKNLVGEVLYEGNHKLKLARFMECLWKQSRRLDVVLCCGGSETWGVIEKRRNDGTKSNCLYQICGTFLPGDSLTLFLEGVLCFGERGAKSDGRRS